jgi:hypothetical protein
MLFVRARSKRRTHGNSGKDPIVGYERSERAEPPVFRWEGTINDVGEGKRRETYGGPMALIGREH